MYPAGQGDIFVVAEQYRLRNVRLIKRHGANASQSRGPSGSLSEVLGLNADTMCVRDDLLELVPKPEAPGA